LKKPPVKTAKFEHSLQPLLPRHLFIRRLLRHGGIACGFLSLSLAFGMVGYHFIDSLSWIDSFLDASMILTGMGPVDAMVSPAAKLFSGLYALYSGIAFLTAAGLFFAPIVHRALHKFQLG
jgi:hypothetical protein